MSQMIDMRFGHGTWSGIVTERAKRIQAAKEAALIARKKKAKEQEELVGKKCLDIKNKCVHQGLTYFNRIYRYHQ